MRALVLLLLTLATARAFHFPGRTHHVTAEKEKEETNNKNQLTVTGLERRMHDLLEKRNHSPHHKAEPAADRLEWQVQDLTRTSESTNTTTWTFSLLLNAASSNTDPSTQTTVSCSLTVPLIQPAAPSGNSADRIGSFYGVPCGTNGGSLLGRISGGGSRFGGSGESGKVSGRRTGNGIEEGVGFEASLGYNQDADSAVMTVCYTPNGTDAWFGFEKVSQNKQLGNSRPEPVYYTGCA
ncbi:uncharacterized protein C8A04DRAFT_24875 [Dichotomopilus funicola]|uniref:Uncharacterized protein n=1 Tax=Dichotomopilus funicola TaxID=1934379 RepID=A0AAN6ZQG2_9PEZI|nr:hypothetical protein C8A04DRAFT_24875 [Dichotomopilus funicola]